MHFVLVVVLLIFAVPISAGAVSCGEGNKARDNGNANCGGPDLACK